MQSWLSRTLPWLALALVLASPAWSAATPDEATLAREVLRLTNARRASVGVAPLALEEGPLLLAARSHSQDMAARGYFSHTSRGGKNVRDRVRLAGGGDSTLGENLYHGPAEAPLEAAASAVQGFMGSQGHRRTMLDPQYNVLAVGVAVAPNGHLYLTEIFASRPLDFQVQAVPRSGRVDLTVNGRVLRGDSSGALLQDGKVVARWSADAKGRFQARAAVAPASRVQLAQVLQKQGNQTRYRIVADLPARR